MCAKTFTRARCLRADRSGALASNPKFAAPNGSRKTTHQISCSRRPAGGAGACLFATLSWRFAQRSGYRLCRRRFLRQLHRPLELRRFFFNAEILGVELVDLRHVVRGERRTLWSLGEFDELFFVVNVRQRRSDTIVSEQPLQCRLPQCAFGIFKETQLLNFLDPVEQPTARSMAAMIGRRELRF